MMWKEEKILTAEISTEAKYTKIPMILKIQIENYNNKSTTKNYNNKEIQLNLPHKKTHQ